MLYVGIGGFIGASIRYIISVNSAKLLGTRLPYGTLIVNVLGAILIGLIMELSLTKNLIDSNSRLFLTTGVLGGLTTFSTFSYETIGLFSAGSGMSATLNICLNLLLSLSGVVLGQLIARVI